MGKGESKKVGISGSETVRIGQSDEIQVICLGISTQAETEREGTPQHSGRAEETAGGRSRQEISLGLTC